MSKSKGLFPPSKHFALETIMQWLKVKHTELLCNLDPGVSLDLAFAIIKKSR